MIMRGHRGFAKMGCKKICKIFASELGFKLGVMGGFQKGITLGGRPSGSACKVTGRWVGGGGNLDFSVYLSPLLVRRETGKGLRDVERGFERGVRGEGEGERREGERRKERREIATINRPTSHYDVRLELKY